MNEAPVVIDAIRAQAVLDLPGLIADLRAGFAKGATVPERHHHDIAQGTGTLLLMPAWQDGGCMGVKIATIHPGNGALGLPAVHATYLLSDAGTGRPLAVIDGNVITARRTIAVAALAAQCCARADASTLLVVGAGRVSRLAAQAFAAVRPIRRVLVWNHTAHRAETLALALREEGFDAASVTDLAGAVGEADIVSCATLSTQPLIRAEWLQPGTHLDLIGSFTPLMREVDDACLTGARVFVDDRSALQESGDLLGPIASGAFRAEDLAGTLADLCAQTTQGRQNAGQITLFKSVGTALADLVAAMRIHRATVAA